MQTGNGQSMRSVRLTINKAGRVTEGWKTQIDTSFYISLPQ
jgi:hypothetical protein